MAAPRLGHHVGVDDDVDRRVAGRLPRDDRVLTEPVTVTAPLVLQALADLVGRRLGTNRESPRLALTKAEAAQALGVSVDHFERHVAHDLRLIRSGRLVLVPVQELGRWVEEQAAYPLGRVA